MLNTFHNICQAQKVSDVDFYGLRPPMVACRPLYLDRIALGRAFDDYADTYRMRMAYSAIFSQSLSG